MARVTLKPNDFGIKINAQSQSQKIALLEYQSGQFQNFMHQLADETSDAAFFRNIHGVLLLVYKEYLKGRALSKGRACEAIPLRNKTIALKYLEEARKRGFIKFEKDKIDARRMLICPQQTLVSYVELQLDKARSEIEELTNLLTDTAASEQLQLAQTTLTATQQSSEPIAASKELKAAHQ